MERFFLTKIRLEFPNGDLQEYPQGIRPIDILDEIGGRLAKETIAAKINGMTIDLTRPIHADGDILFISADSPDGREVYWHSTAHVMAHAVKELFPEAQFAFGPPVDQGFYYDIDVDRAFTPEDLEKIENKMKEIVSQDNPFIREEPSVEQVLTLFRDKKESYK